MSSEEPPPGQQPNPYGPPPGSGGPPSGHPWGTPPPAGGTPVGPPPQQWPPPQPSGWPPQEGGAAGRPTYGPSGEPTVAPWQAPGPPTGGGGGRGRRNGIIALVAVLVLLLAGGGTALALVLRVGGDGAAKDDEKTSEPSESPSASDPSPSAPEGSDGPAPAAPGAPDPEPGEDDSTDPTWRGYPQADDFEEDWEFRWEDTAFNARSVVTRGHSDCADIAADDRLIEFGCRRAVTATYVNERDQVTFTNYYLKFRDGKTARKVTDMKKADTLVKITGDAVWEDWKRGGWRISHTNRYVILTAATAPGAADEETVQADLRWAHKDFALALQLHKDTF